LETELALPRETAGGLQLIYGKNVEVRAGVNALTGLRGFRETGLPFGLRAAPTN
jgi:hypothetical protein